jgi:O-succinylbenzoic acid--CoA ligase
VYDGVALDGIDVRIRDDGRIEVRGTVMFAGYLGGTEQVSNTPVDDDGWFTTGDVGRIAGGRLEVLGRSDDVVISGGENVPLDAVAAALRTHPAVADAAAATRPDKDWGEIVVAVVVPTDTASPPDLAELRAHVLATHPRAYAPHTLVLTDALPRDQLGKLSRTGLNALASGPERL